MGRPDSPGSGRCRQSGAEYSHRTRSSRVRAPAPREGNWCRGWHGTITACSAWPRARRRTRSSGPTGSWPGNCIPTSTPTRPPSSGSRRSPRPTRCSPTRPSGRSSTSAGTRSAAAPGRAVAPVGWATRSAGWASATSWTPSSAAAAAARSRGPRSRVRQGEDALIPVELTLEECADRRRQGPGRGHRHAVHVVPRLRLRGRHPPGHLRHVQGLRRGAADPAVAARPGRHVPALPGVPGLRRGHPRSLPAVQRRGSGPHPADRAGEHPGRRRRRHPGSAGRPGRGRTRRRRARRPVRRGPGATARAVHPRRHRPALHGARADDGGRPRHLDGPADPARRRGPGHPARHPIRPP